LIGFDTALLRYLNGFAGQSEAFDRLAYTLAFNRAIKAGLVVVVLYALWFAARGGGAAVRTRRTGVLATFMGMLVAIALNRWVATLLEFRVRPLNDLEFGFRPTYGMQVGSFADLSAFPSDHAVMYVALATGVLLCSRLAGVLLLLHTALVILPPRLYLGLHWPSDILAGAALGAGVALLFNLPPVQERIGRVLLRWYDAHPLSFYALFFLATMEFALQFREVEQVGYFILRLLGHSGAL
jgi:undecaprenyl-diphosphatase